MSELRPPAPDAARTAVGAASGQVGRPFVLPAAASAPPVVRDVGSGVSPIALLAGAGAALLGGLIWAGVVVVTQYDIGILAWLVGAVTAGAIVRVVGGPVGIATRVIAGALAAGAIMVGKYVIFVHEVRAIIGAELASRGVSVGYLSTHSMSVFLHNFSSIVRPIYALWVALAIFAAVRVASGHGRLAQRFGNS